MKKPLKKLKRSRRDYRIIALTLRALMYNKNIELTEVERCNLYKEITTVLKEELDIKIEDLNAELFVELNYKQFK